MADPPVTDAGNEPAGRTDPNAEKGPLGFSWIIWGGMAAAVFAAVWFMRSRSGSSGATPTVSDAGSSGGSLPADPLTSQAILDALNKLIQQGQAGTSGSGSTQPPSPGADHSCPPGFHAVWLGIMGSAGGWHCAPDISKIVPKPGGNWHVTARNLGGSATGHVTVPHVVKLPKVKVSTAVAGAKVPTLKPINFRRSYIPGTVTKDAPTTKKKTSNIPKGSALDRFFSQIPGYAGGYQP